MTNAVIADKFDELGELLDLAGENPFRARAYHTAARTLRDIGYDLPGMIRRGEPLPKIPGIGSDLAGKIREIATTGHTPLLDQLRKSIPPALLELMRIPGLGPKRVKLLYDQLGIRSTEELAEACREHRVRSLHGFGEKTEEHILQALGELRDTGRRYLLSEAAPVAQRYEAYLKEDTNMKQVITAGSYRRGKETVGDLDILVTGLDPAAAVKRFTTFPDVMQVLASGPTRAAVRLNNGLQVDLRVVPAESYGAALHYFTGSKAHNIAVRQLGIARGYKINEYGVFEGTRRIAGETEESVYRAVGLPYIEPELRENRGEIEAAARGRLPPIVAGAAIQGDLHLRPPREANETTLGALLTAARALGWRYVGFVDAFDPKGDIALQRRRFTQRTQMAARLAKSLGILVFRGWAIAADQLEATVESKNDDAPNTLRLGDYWVVEPPVEAALPSARQTTLILKLMQQSHRIVLSRMTGRTLPDGEPAKLDWERIFRAAADREVWLEIDGTPEHLDLPDVLAKRAGELGAAITLTSRAATGTELQQINWAVLTARRAWLTAAQVVNTRDSRLVRTQLRQRSAHTTR